MTLDAVPAGQSADHEQNEYARSCAWVSGCETTVALGSTDVGQVDPEVVPELASPVELLPPPVHLLDRRQRRRRSPGGYRGRHVRGWVVVCELWATSYDYLATESVRATAATGATESLGQ